MEEKDIIICGDYKIGIVNFGSNYLNLTITYKDFLHYWNREIANLLNMDENQYTKLIQNQFNVKLIDLNRGDLVFDFKSYEDVKQAMHWVESQLIGITLIK